MFQLPDEPFLRELYHQWQLQPDLIIIRDARTGRNTPLCTLLRDVVLARQQVLAALGEKGRTQLQKKYQDVYVVLLVPTGYEFVVLFLAIYSLGAVTVPMSTAVLAEEAEYFIDMCSAALFVTTQEHTDQATAISAKISVQTLVHELSTVSNPTEDIQLTNDPPVDLDRGASLLFTSGTTGKPKGVLHNRRALYEQGKAIRDFHGFSTKDLYLLALPMNWVGGFGMMVFCTCSVMPTEYCASAYSPQWFWQRMQAGGVTCWISSFPSVSRIEAYFRANSATWTDAEIQAIKAGTRSLRLIEAGAMPITDRVKSFWAELRGGRRFEVDYGMSETMLFITSTGTGSDEAVAANCVGVPLPGVSIKIAEDNEILLKTPGMFTRYLSEDLKATRKAFDDEGYFRTGDVGKMVGGELYVLGRASSDVIRFDGYVVFGPEVEAYLYRLDFVAGAWVIGIPDETKHHRVGALIALKGDQRPHSLAEIQLQLVQVHAMNAYKLPTVLRVLREGEELPITGSGKPNKKRIAEQFFGEADFASGLIEVSTLETNPTGNKPFDWAGLPYVS